MINTNNNKQKTNQMEKKKLRAEAVFFRAREMCFELDSMFSEFRHKAYLHEDLHVTLVFNNNNERAMVYKITSDKNGVFNKIEIDLVHTRTTPSGSGYDEGCKSDAENIINIVNTDENGKKLGLFADNVDITVKNITIGGDKIKLPDESDCDVVFGSDTYFATEEQQEASDKLFTLAALWKQENDKVMKKCGMGIEVNGYIEGNVSVMFYKGECEAFEVYFTREPIETEQFSKIEVYYYNMEGVEVDIKSLVQEMFDRFNQGLFTKQTYVEEFINE